MTRNLCPYYKPQRQTPRSITIPIISRIVDTWHNAVIPDTVLPSPDDYPPLKPPYTHTMSPYSTLFAYFGLYLLFMLGFFVIICLICLLVLLRFRRKFNQDATSLTEPRENTPMRRPCKHEF